MKPNSTPCRKPNNVNTKQTLDNSRATSPRNRRYFCTHAPSSNTTLPQRRSSHHLCRRQTQMCRRCDRYCRCRTGLVPGWFMSCENRTHSQRALKAPFDDNFHAKSSHSTYRQNLMQHPVALCGLERRIVINVDEHQGSALPGKEHGASQPNRDVSAFRPNEPPFPRDQPSTTYRSNALCRRAGYGKSTIDADRPTHVISFECAGV